MKESYPSFVKQEILDELSYNKARSLYNKRVRELYDEFKNDLFNNFGVTNNPKAEKLFDLCLSWKGGNYEGAYEIFEQFVELIR